MPNRQTNKGNFSFLSGSTNEETSMANEIQGPGEAERLILSGRQQTLSENTEITKPLRCPYFELLNFSPDTKLRLKARRLRFSPTNFDIIEILTPTRQHCMEVVSEVVEDALAIRVMVRFLNRTSNVLERYEIATDGCENPSSRLGGFVRSL